MHRSPDTLSPADKLAILTRAAGLLSSSTEFTSGLGQVISAYLPSLGDAGFFDLRVDGADVVLTRDRIRSAQNEHEHEQRREDSEKELQPQR